MAGAILIVAVVLIVLALVYFLGLVIFELQKITEGLDTAIDALEGLLVKKAGLPEAMGLIEGLYPGAKKDGLRNFPDSATVKSPRIGEVYTRGTLTLARLGR